MHAFAPTARGVQLHTGSFNDDCVGAQYAAIAHRERSLDAIEALQFADQ
jgi:hypothetical protein